MPLINESYESLPLVDGAPSQTLAAVVDLLIQASIESTGADSLQLHPALIPAAAYSPQFSEAVELEHARLQAEKSSKLRAIDLKRYEDLEAPPNTDPTTDEDSPELFDKWTDALKRACTSSEYINGRLTQLGLLERFGKNAWLIGNSQLEDILKAIETQLADVKKQHEETEEMRRNQQWAVSGEMTMLDDAWRRGVEQAMETEAAADRLKRLILDKRRAGAV
ncbi:uncharacterized protein BDR25DRAFT_301091 [Lindgomyces ingoldianus]|uniref:Uncharacterized protein n=1 Tax=Lindgomyces ingoldianus TaxID=673940 RepID=A0ACB6RAP5_9PLEO|nr:uncharacterized protein BDR25DRAFT_301091 [Lindgomyces ingoldianus]KAF2475415.1 hypothetical protein BDR25DRAFT_301091 [Lindgomyces ingoldianus]